METAQINSPRFSYQTAAPAARTLDDLRIVHSKYTDMGSSFSGKSMRPMLISVLVAAAVAGTAIGLHRYSEKTTEKINATANVADPSVPAAASVRATESAVVAPAAKDSPATNPLSPMTKSEEANSMPFAGQGNNHSSESLNPVKAANSVAAKSAAAVPKPVAAKAAVTPAAPIATSVSTTPVREATPPASPPPSVIEEKPIVPPPAPVVEPTPPEPPKQ